MERAVDARRRAVTSAAVINDKATNLSMCWKSHYKLASQQSAYYAKSMKNTSQSSQSRLTVYKNWSKKNSLNFKVLMYIGLILLLQTMNPKNCDSPLLVVIK